MLLEAWKTFEEQHGTDEDRAKVEEMLPKTRKRWRKAEDGSGQLEEYWDLVFPDDERDANPASYKFFQAAQEWKAKQAAAGVADGALGAGGLSYDMSDSDDDSDEEEEDGEGEAGEQHPDGEGGREAGEAMDEDD